jgi:hypothetical protein
MEALRSPLAGIPTNPHDKGTRNIVGSHRQKTSCNVNGPSKAVVQSQQHPEEKDDAKEHRPTYLA